MLRNRHGGWVRGSLALASAAVSIVGCGGESPAADSGTDTGMSIMLDASRDAFRRTGDAFDNYVTAVTAADREECECSWMEQGFKSAAACLEDKLMNGEVIQCQREGYMAARSASAPSYECQTDPLETYAACRMAAGCDDGDAIGACVDAVDAALGACPELPMEAQDAFAECFRRDFIGPASTCPESGAPWMGVGTFTGDTTVAGNDSDPDESCFADGMLPDMLEIAPDRAYRWIAPAPGTYTFDTADSEFDTVLYVRNSCASTETVACNDDVDDETATSQLSLTATSAGQEFIVVVDGFYAVSQGQFTVAVTMGPGSDAGMTTMPDAGMSGADAGVGPDAP